MNDYLGKLAAKQLKCAEILEPRPASLFEPVRPSEGLARLESPAEHQSSGEATSTVLSPGNAAGLREATASADADRLEQAPAQPLSDPREQFVQRQAQQPFPHRIAPTSVQPPLAASLGDIARESSQRLSAPGTGVEHEQTSINMDRTTLADLDSMHETSAESTSDLIESGCNPGPTPSSQSGNPEKVPETAQSLPPSQPVLTEAESTVTAEQMTGVAPENTIRHSMDQTSSPERTEPPDTFPGQKSESIIGVAPRGRMVVDWSEAQSSMRAPVSKSTPIVRVTIGRIEVRAVTAPTTAPPQAVPSRPSRNLSLDDYLRQRNERR
jgi:hypothetical protein